MTSITFVWGAMNEETSGLSSDAPRDWRVPVVSLVLVVQAEVFHFAQMGSTASVLLPFVVSQAAIIIGVLAASFFKISRKHRPLSRTGYVLCGLIVVFFVGADLASMLTSYLSTFALICLVKVAVTPLFCIASVVIWCLRPRELARWLIAVVSFVLMVWNMYLFVRVLFAIDQV